MVPLLIALTFLPASLPEVTCDDVRRVRAAAVAQGLDDHALQVLEAQVCLPSVTPLPAQGERAQDCLDLQMMQLLGAATEPPHLDEIDRLAHIACSFGLTDAPLRWRNGLSARALRGGWSWPNGITAKGADGAWSWPNGITARASSGSFSYPSGIQAVSSSGAWSFPSGMRATREEVLGDVCSREALRCRQIARLVAIHPDLATAAMVALVWQAR